MLNCPRRAVLAWAASAVAAHAAPPLLRESAAAATRLPAPVAQALRASGLPMTAFGLYARQVDGPQVLASLNAESIYVLASTAKVVTSLAALDLLGPRYRWRTTAYATGPVIEGRLLGDLVIVGGGDASLRSEQVLQWFGEIRSGGLREVAGDIVLQRSAFELTEEDHAQTPTPTPSRPYHVRPDSLMLDEGLLRVLLQSAGSGPGHTVTLQPPVPNLDLIDRIRPGAGCASWAHVGTAQGRPQLSLSGTWNRGCAIREIVLAPPWNKQLSARGLAGLWQQAGGVLKGRVREQPADQRVEFTPLPYDGKPPEPLGMLWSPPLANFLRDMNKTSNNVMARALMLSMVPGFPVRPATMSQAQQRVADWLASRGFQGDDLVVENGSGLSRAERGRPRALVDLLRQGWSGREAQIFVDSLPVAGVDGTLAHRLQDSAATGSAWLKTGSLRDTTALAGYVRGRSGRVFAMTAIVHHNRAEQGKRAIDTLVRWIAESA